MAGIGDIVEKIALEGDSEIAEAFHKLGEIGVETFEKIGESVAEASGSFGIFNLALAGVTAAIGVATTALISFAAAQDASIVKSEALARSFGTTTDGLDAVKETFAEAGVNSQQFSNAVQRMAISIQQSWSEIRRDAREGADQIANSYLNIRQSGINLQKAQDTLGETSTHLSQTMVHDIFAIREAVLSLESANNRLATTFANAGLAARGATLSVQQAQLKVDLNANPNADQGGQRKKQLQEQQDQLALENAQAARRDLIEKQILEDQQNILAAQKAQQAVYDANIKAADDEAHAVTTLKEAVLDVQKARIAESEAANHAYDVQVHNVGVVKESLLALIETGKQAASSIDFADVQVNTLIHGIQAAASARNGGGQASGADVLKTTADLFHNDTEKMISDSQRLAIAQRLISSGMHGVASSGAELVAILNEGSSAFDKHTAKAEETSHAYADNVEAARAFIVASTSLGNTIEKVKDHFASLVSPGLAEFLKQIQESLLDSSGNLRLFLSGIEAIVVGIQKIIGYVNDFIKRIDDASKSGDGLRAVFLVLGGVLTLLGRTWGVWGIAIGLIIEAVGAVYQNWDKIKAKVMEIIEVITGPFVKAFKFLEEVAERIWAGLTRGINAVIDGIKSLASYLGGTKSAVDAKVPTASDVPAHAAGGVIRGPGTGTSDSVMARLSNGEFVMRSAAVSHFGENFMAAINDMSLPRFADGGAVGDGFRRNTPGTAFTGSAAVNGKLLDFILDTGASYVTLMFESAKAASINMKNLDFSEPTSTANGIVKAASVLLQTVQVGDILKRGVNAFVMPEGALGVNLLGLSFLNMLKSWGVGPDGQVVLQAAQGGMIRGPGSASSDSIPARLSNGEFVMRNAAVSHFGEHFMHMINNMAFPGFANGGPVLAGARGPGSFRGGSPSTINLSIDGNRFDGLLAPPHVADKLTKYAVERQASSAGNKPSWYK